MMPAGPPPVIAQHGCRFSAMRFQSNTAQIRMKANMPETAQGRAAFPYNAAADFYDASPLSFWDYFGRRTMELASLSSGSRVLDVCCGAGASALPAAEAVGPTGNVVGLRPLQSSFWNRRGRKQFNGVLAISNLKSAICSRCVFLSRVLDAVVCVFGIFFVPDMANAVSELWSRVRPGGKLAVTTWGPKFCEPANAAFWSSIKDVRPDLYKGFQSMGSDQRSSRPEKDSR